MPQALMRLRERLKKDLMKIPISITGWLLLNAIDDICRAYDAHNQKLPEEEMRCSLSAYIMTTLSIEGFGNEVGESTFNKWAWQRLEKSDTPLKWYILSAHAGRKCFDQAREPLQTIQRLMSIRNAIAHPKVQDGGDEIIVRTKSGKLTRRAARDHRLEEGDVVFLGLGKLLDAYNYYDAYWDTCANNQILRTKEG